jgi:hypothetical protein
MTETDIAPMAQIIASRLRSVVDRAAIDIVLITLLQLRNEFQQDRLAFEDKHSNGDRLAFDRRLLLFLQDAPAPAGTMRFHDGGLGGRMA